MNSKVSNERRAISGQPNRGCLGIMQDTRSDNADAETAYAVLKAGYRPFDCSRQALRRELLTILGAARKLARNPAEVVNLAQERSRRDQGCVDPNL